MRKILSFSLLAFLLLIGTNAWADDYAVAYTFTITKPSSGAVTDYTKTGDMTIDGITWTVPGNWYADGQLRIGGKSITNAKRTITGKGTISNAITKITVNHSGVSSTNLVINSVTLTVASNSSFTENVITKTVNPTVSKNTAGSFDLTPNTPCPANRYYKIEFDVSNSNSSNYALTLNSIVFYKSNVPHTLSSAVSPVGAGSVSLSNTSLIYGATATATAVASPGYRFTGWSISNATVSSTSTNPTTVTMGDVDATITANFETATTYAVKWNVNGVDVQTDYVAEDEAITFPTSITGIPGGYKFKGWSAETIDGTVDSYSSYVTSADATANVTYYAVMAVESRIPASITKMKKGDTFTSGDKIVIAAIDEDNSFGMYQQTQSSSYVKNYSFSEDAEEIASDDKKWWTVTASSTSWILGDATNGYLYSSSSTNLSVDAENQTLFVFEDCNNGKFNLSYTNGTKRYLCCRTDLDSDKKNLFRLSSADGINELSLYKYTPASFVYSNYCTSVLEYTLYPTPDLYYTTFYDASSNVSLPDGVTAYWGEYDEGELTLKAFSGANADVVPAGHAVILKASSASAFNVTTTAATAFDMTGIENDLIGSTGTAANANTYVLAYQGSPAATGFFKMTSGTIPAHKAYLDLTSGGGAPSAIRIVEEENNATNLSNIESTDKVVKFIQNGQLFIKRNGVVYDIMGHAIR